MTCLGDSSAVQRLHTIKNLFGRTPLKNMLEKCAKSDARKSVLINSEKMKNMCEQRKKLAKKGSAKTVKNAVSFGEKCSARTAGRPLLSAKRKSRNFSRFSGQAVCSPLLEGVRFVTHGPHVRGIVNTDTGVCIHPSLASRFPRRTHI